MSQSTRHPEILNIGTSTEAVAQELRHHRDLLVVTNNMNVANILSQNQHCQVIVTGGTLRQSDGGLIGDVTTNMIRQFKFDIGVIGCSALDRSGDILDFDLQEVGVSRTILEQSRKTILIADHSKLKRAASARIASLAKIDIFVTDRAVNDALAQSCADWKTQIIIADAFDGP